MTDGRHQDVHLPRKGPREGGDSVRRAPGRGALHGDEAYCVGFNVEGQDVGLDPHGHSKGMTGPVGYWHVDDIKKSLKALLNAGAEAHQEVRDVGGGKLIASMKDADGNVIGLIQSA